MWLAVRRQLGRKAGRCQESAAMLARSVSSSAATFGQNDDPFQRPQGTVDFGYQHVPREEKQTLVGQVFSSVAGSYDIMNDLMSGGMHRLWKDRLVEKLRPRPGHRHLDVAGGTGDVAFRVWDAMRASNRGYGGRSSSFPSPSSVGSAVEDATVAAEGLGAAAAEGVAKAAAGVAPPAAAERLADAAAGYKQERLQHQDQLEQQQFHRQEAQLLQQDLAEQQQVHLEEQRLRGALPAVTVCDINTAMLAEGRRKAEARGIGPESVQWVEGNAEALPFPSNSFDSYTIAFGIRNVTDRPAALREAHRVLRPGGRLLCLEFSKLVVPGMQQLYDLYSFNVIPQIGRVVANDAASYQYLVESIRLFPDQETWAGMIEQAGFKGVDYENLSLGVVAIHSAFKMG